MKKRITITIDSDLYKAHDLDKNNASKFINELLRLELLNQRSDLVAKHVIQDILNDDEYMNALVLELQRKTKDPNVEYTDDWGA